MDHHSILKRNEAAAEPASAAENSRLASAQARLAKALRFPANDGGQSLAEMARRDLQATLQLLVERAQYITGAAGAAIALWEDALMVCRASAGGSAPEIGAHLQINSGLSGESVRSRHILRCDDAETDPRVNRESCRALGISSVVVMPLTAENDVVGVVELFSDQPHAFSERDVAALERIGEMIHTALLHAEVARQLEETRPTEAPSPQVVEPASASPAVGPEEEILPVETGPAPHSPKGPLISLQYPLPGEPSPVDSALDGALDQLAKCESCGFPVSSGRGLCVDCEAARTRGELAPSLPPAAAPPFLSQYDDAAASSPRTGRKYLIATVVLAILLAILFLAYAGFLRLPS